MSEINHHIQQILPEIVILRKKLHQIPELKYEEYKTSALIAETLIKYGYEIQQNIAKTGIVALLDTGRPGKTIALRADMDALPIQEPWHANSSQHSGVMHACGHDGHCAALLAAAYALQQVKHRLKGKIKLIFQPAEEGGKGSSAMIAAGVLDNPAVDAIYGFHNWPGLPINTVAVKPGAILLGNGRITLGIHGKAAHTSQPEQAINPVLIGAMLITALQSLAQQLVAANAVLNILAFNSGDVKKGMSIYAEIIAVYYIETHQQLEQLQTEINSLCATIAKQAGTKIDCQFQPFHTPTINHVNETQVVLTAANKITENIHQPQKSMLAAEDFSAYLEKIPGCFWLLGIGESAAAVHTANYVFNDNILATAAELFCQVVLQESLHVSG